MRQTMMLEIELLGHFHLVYRGEPVTTVSAPKRRLLLAYLLLHPEVALSRRRLAFKFWPDSEESQALTNLRKQLHHLRRELPQPDNFLHVNSQTLQWRPDAPYSLDVDQFEGAVAQATEATDEATVRARLKEAASIYQGDLLPGLYADWLLDRRAQLRQHYLQVLDQLMSLLAGQGALEAAVSYGQRLLAEDPLRERVYRRLMRLLARQGERAQAVEVYQACVEVLERELDTAPSLTTRRVYEQIVLEAEPTRHNLPAQPRPLIARQQEMAEIGARLRQPNCRLLTLVGPPGVGKTRLALAAARKEVGHFLHGITFVPLTPLQTPALLPLTIVDAVGIRQGSKAPKAQLLNYLESREMLLVLDNFEHLLPAVGLLDELLSRAPAVQLLVTSRERLNLQWEWVLDLEGLPYPGNKQTDELQQFPAVQLFSHQAQRLQPDFPVDEGERHCTAEICRLVAGNPLAITLAAAWIGPRSCRDIAAEIRHNVTALQAPWHDVPQRHRSLHAAVEHSWSLLSPVQQQVLRGLSVFRGGFGEEAAQKVTGASTAELAALVTKSLVQHTFEKRFDLHEMIRQFAAAKLSELSAEQERLREAHSWYYVTFLERMNEQWRGKSQQRAIRRVAEEFDNVRLAWDRAVSQADADKIRKGGDGLFLFCEVQTRYREARDLFAAATGALEEKGGKQDEALTLSILYHGWFAFYLGSVEVGKTLMRRGRALARQLGDRFHEALANYGLGMVAYADGRREKAERLFRAALAFFREGNFPAHHAHSLNYMGTIAEHRGEPDRAEALHRKSLPLHEAAGDTWGIGRTFVHLAEVAAQRGNFEQARRWLEKSLKILRRFGDDRGVIFALNLLAESRRQQDQTAQAREAVEEAVAVASELGEKNLEVLSQRNLAEICLDMNEERRAQKHLHRSLALAADVASQPRLAEVLVTIARLFLHHERREEALALLAYVAADPHTEARTRQQARRLASQTGVTRLPEGVPAQPKPDVHMLLSTLSRAFEG